MAESGASIAVNSGGLKAAVGALQALAGVSIAAGMKVREFELTMARCRFQQMVRAIAPASEEELEAEVQRRLEAGNKIGERKAGQPMNLAKAYESVTADLQCGRLRGSSG